MLKKFSKILEFHIAIFWAIEEQKSKTIHKSIKLIYHTGIAYKKIKTTIPKFWINEGLSPKNIIIIIIIIVKKRDIIIFIYYYKRYWTINLKKIFKNI